MGFQANINKITELDERFKPSFYSNSTPEEIQDKIQEQKLDIISACMNPESIRYTSLKLMCRILVSLIEDEEKAIIVKRVEEDDGKLWYCGWEYAKEYSEFDKDSILNRMIEDLIILNRVVKTPDYFDESEKFFEKLQHLKDALDIDELIQDIIRHELIRFYGLKPDNIEEEIKTDIENE